MTRVLCLPAPLGVSDGDELIHTCRDHPYIGQDCHEGCVAFCGHRFTGDCDEVHVGPPTPDCCIVCEELFSRLDGLLDLLGIGFP